MSKYCMSCGAANVNTANVCTRCGEPLTNEKGWSQNFEQTKEVSGIYLKRLITILNNILKDPVENGRKFVTGGERKLCIGFLAVQAALSSVFTLILAKEINGVIKQIAEISISYLKVFLITAIGSMVVSFAIAGLLYLVAALFKEKMSFGKALNIIAVRSVGVDIILVLSIVVACLNLSYGIVIFALAWLGGLVFMLPAIQSEGEVNANRTPYIAIIVTALSFVVYYLWIKTSLPMYVPSELKEWMEQILDGLGKLKDFNIKNLGGFW